MATYPGYRAFNARTINKFNHFGVRIVLTPAERQRISERVREGESPMDLALEYPVTASYIRYLGRR